MSSVTLKNISKSYSQDIPVIQDIDLNIQDGEFIVFVGPSGCGKSTLLRMIAGLEDITEGELYIGDQLANEVHASQRGIAMVFQSYALYPHMSVEKNMGFALKIAGMSSSEIAKKVEAAADILQMRELLKRKPKELSGGQRQRVAIGRAIVREPKVFLFDEPLSNLDASLRQNMRIELAKLHKKLGNTMIYVTHDQVEAMTLADRIVLFNQGIVQQVGTPLELYDHPANTFVAGFLGAPKMNFIQGELTSLGSKSESKLGPKNAIIQFNQGQTHMTSNVDCSQATQNSVTVGIRPENLKIVSAQEDHTVIGTINVIEQLGDHVLIYLEVPGQSEQLCVKSADRHHQWNIGDQLYIVFPPEHCHVFDSTGLAFTMKVQ